MITKRNLPHIRKEVFLGDPFIRPSIAKDLFIWVSNHESEEIELSEVPIEFMEILAACVDKNEVINLFRFKIFMREVIARQEASYDDYLFKHVSIMPDPELIGMRNLKRAVWRSLVVGSSISHEYTISCFTKSKTSFTLDSLLRSRERMNAVNQRRQEVMVEYLTNVHNLVMNSQHYMKFLMILNGTSRTD